MISNPQVGTGGAGSGGLVKVVTSRPTLARWTCPAAASLCSKTGHPSASADTHVIPPSSMLSLSSPWHLTVAAFSHVVSVFTNAANSQNRDGQRGGTSQGHLKCAPTADAPTSRRLTAFSSLSPSFAPLFSQGGGGLGRIYKFSVPWDCNGKCITVRSCKDVTRRY